MGRVVELDHTADACICVYGEDLADLFSTAASGLMDLLADYDAGAKATTQYDVKLSASDIETLLVDWLSELLFLSEEYMCAFSKVHFITLSPATLTLHATMDAVPILEHRHYIKAVTYSEMQVEQINGEWTTAIVFDL